MVDRGCGGDIDLNIELALYAKYSLGLEDYFTGFGAALAGAPKTGAPTDYLRL